MRAPVVYLITGNSPNTNTSALIGAPIVGLRKYDTFNIDAIIIGGTGGTLDVTLQRKIGNLSDGTAVDLWVDWLHFTQVAATVTARYSAFATGFQSSTSVTTVGMVATATFTTTLAAGTFVGGHPGDQLRAVCTAGTSTSAGAAQKIYVTCWKSQN